MSYLKVECNIFGKTMLLIISNGYANLFINLFITVSHTSINKIRYLVFLLAIYRDVTPIRRLPEVKFLAI